MTTRCNSWLLKPPARQCLEVVGTVSMDRAVKRESLARRRQVHKSLCIAGRRAGNLGGPLVGQEFLIRPQLDAEPPQKRKEEPEALGQARPGAEARIALRGVGQFVDEDDPQRIAVELILVVFRWNQDA